ncbi:hypothetical protein [Prosthecobacter sp.]|uniref:hypothetical protein n=1 Tax=Prosthecobacter sp. TaxID=1965333 RepID=UPI003784576B
METLSVRCNHCGAPLQVADKTRFVTCQFCHSSLEVKRTENSIFTEEVAKIAENTGKMAGSLEIITLQNELERLDREMGVEHLSAAMNKNKSGSGTAGRLMGTLFGVFFTVVCIVMGTGFLKAGAGIFAIVPIGMALFGVAISVASLRAGLNEDTSRATYLTRREDLERQIAALKQK